MIRLLATWPLIALTAAVLLSRWLRRNDEHRLAATVAAACEVEKHAEATPIGDAALLAALDIDLEIEKARAYLAAIETGDDLLYALGEDL